MTHVLNSLKLSDNSKTKFKKNHYNTFGLWPGLPANGGTCPGATIGAGGCLGLKREGGVNLICYVDKLIKIYPNFGAVLRFNTDLLAGKTQPEMEEIHTNTVQAFIKHNKGLDLFFRLATSGDFFSEDYARSWATVINNFPQVHFWAYTRSLWAIPILMDCRNLSLYISSDRVNYQRATEVYNKYVEGRTNLGICYMGDDDTIPHDRRWVKCPEITGKVKNSPDEGACSKCRLCFTHNGTINRRNIQFPIH